MASPLDWAAEPFLVLYAALLLGAWGLSLALRPWLLRGPALGPMELGPVDLALLSDGRTRAADAVAVGLLEAGAATLGAGDSLAVSADAPVPPWLASYRADAGQAASRAALIQSVMPRIEAAHAALVRRGLAPGEAQLRRAAHATHLAFGAVLAFGLVRVWLGMSRDRPVGFLMFLMVVGLVLLVLVARPVPATPAGQAALAASRTRHSRAARAPLGGELALAFALSGPIVLTGTELAPYQKVMAPASNSDGSGGGCGGGGSSSDGGGSDGGGSGCGGCGGE